MNQDPPSRRPSSAKLPLKLKTAKIAFSVVPYGESSKTPPPAADAATPKINSSRNRNSNSIKPDLTKFQNENSTQEEQHQRSVSSTSNVSLSLSPITTTQEKAFSFANKTMDEIKKQQQHNNNHESAQIDDDQDDILLFFKNVVKDSLDKATKISLQPNSGSDIDDSIDTNNSSFRSSVHDSKNVKYERAKQEAAVASVAVLEGLVDLLRRRIALQSVKPKRRASSTVSLFRGLNEIEENQKELSGAANVNNNNNLPFLISMADTLEASILGLKAIILPTLAINNDHRHTSNASTSFFEKRFNVALQKNLISENTPVSLIESTKQRMKTYHRSLFSPHQFDSSNNGNNEHQQHSSILTPEIASRIQNCDRMLELLRKKKRFFSAKNSLLQRETPTNLSSVLITATQRTNPWADAEDALHVLRLRFVFHLWKNFSRCERQRRMNSFRFTQKLVKERAKVQLLHTFLSFKRSQTQSSVLAAKNAIKENQVLLKKVGEAEEKVKKSAQQVEQVNFLYRNSLTEIEELRDKIEENERTPMILDFRRPIRDTVSGDFIQEGILEFRKVVTHDNNNNSKSRQNHYKRTSIIDIENEKSSPKEFFSFPPFVDWNCPQQNAHARELLQVETIERLSEKKGIGIPGYQQPSSFYEIRVSQGFSCEVSDKMLKETNNTNGIKNFLSNCFASNFSTKRWDVEFVAFVNGILKKVIMMNNNDCNNNNHSIVNRTNIKMKNKEMVESFNKARARRNCSSVFEKSTTNHPKKQGSLQNEDGEINNKFDLIADEPDANFEWDINEPFGMQLVHREYFGIVIPSSVTSTLLLNRSMSMNIGSNNKMSKSIMINTGKKKIDFGIDADHVVVDVESDSSSSSFQDEEEEEDEERREEEERREDEDEDEQVPSAKSATKNDKKKEDTFLGSFLFSKKNLSASSAQNNFVTISKKKQVRNKKVHAAVVEVISPLRTKSFSKSILQHSSFRNPPTELEKIDSENANIIVKQEELSQRSHQITPTPLDLLVEAIINTSLTNLKESITSRNRQLSDETEFFVRTSTENILEVNRAREEKNEKDRNDLVKKQEFVMMSADAEVVGSHETSNHGNKKYSQKQKNLTANFCPVATSSISSRGWEISSLSELIANPEASLQLLTIIFGKIAITESLRKYFRENHDEANELHIFITFQKNSSHNTNLIPFFNKVVSILVNDLLISRQNHQNDSNEQDSPANSLRTVFSSVQNGDDIDFVAVGRTFCVLLQQHLIFTMSEQEKQCRKIESNSLMLRRLLKASFLKR